MKRVMLAFVLAASLGAAADPVAWKVAAAPAAAVKAGARFTVKVTAEVQEGWHLYSLKPMAEGPIATRIWIAEGQPFTLAGAIAAPAPQVQHFGANNAVSPSWMNHLRLVMKYANKRNRITDDELDQGLSEIVVYGSPAPLHDPSAKSASDKGSPETPPADQPTFDSP